MSDSMTSHSGDSHDAREPLSRRFVAAFLSTPLLFCCHLVAVFVFCFLSLHVVSRLVESFYNEDTRLPGITVSMLSFHLFMTRYWYLLVGVFLLFDGVTLFVLRLLSTRGRAIRGWLFSGVLMLVIVGIGWILFAISLPMNFPERSDRAPASSSASQLQEEATVDSVRRIVSEQMGVPIERVSPTTSLGDLGADELDHVELIMELEETFSISIPDDRLQEVADSQDFRQGMNNVTVRRLAELVDDLKAADKSSPN